MEIEERENKRKSKKGQKKEPQWLCRIGKYIFFYSWAIRRINVPILLLYKFIN